MSGRAHGLLGRRWVETRKSSAADANGDVGGCGIEKEEEGAGGSACTRRTSAGEGTAGRGHGRGKAEQRAGLGERKKQTSQQSYERAEREQQHVGWPIRFIALPLHSCWCLH